MLKSVTLARSVSLARARAGGVELREEPAVLVPPPRGQVAERLEEQVEQAGLVEEQVEMVEEHMVEQAEQAAHLARLVEEVAEDRQIRGWTAS